MGQRLRTYKRVSVSPMMKSSLASISDRDAEDRYGQLPASGWEGSSIMPSSATPGRAYMAWFHWIKPPSVSAIKLSGKASVAPENWRICWIGLRVQFMSQ